MKFNIAHNNFKIPMLVAFMQTMPYWLAFNIVQQMKIHGNTHNPEGIIMISGAYMGYYGIEMFIKA